MNLPIWARREIDHGRDLPADQLFRRVVHGDLGRGFLHAKLGAEIDRQPQRRLARTLERRCFHDGADSDVDLVKSS
jgi:hypothetical protein